MRNAKKNRPRVKLEASSRQPQAAPSGEPSPRAEGTPRPFRPPRWQAHLPPLALFAVLALWAAYPLWLAPASRIEDLGDPLLTAWMIHWDHFALFHQPFQFFQANIFWPVASSLAYGEHILTQAILALPLRLFTTNPVALNNLSLIQGYFLSAVAAYLLGLYYFRALAPAALCGLAYGLAAYRVDQSSHLQLVHGEFLPLMVLAFERVLATGRQKWCWLLGLAALGQWLTSWYWAVYTFWCVVPYMAVRLAQARRGLSGRRLAAIFLPLAAAALLTLPIAWPYLQLKQGGLLLRSGIETTVDYSAHPLDFLTPMRHSLLYGWIPLTVNMERALFPGLLLPAGFCASLVFCFKKRNQNLEDVGENGAPVFPLRLWMGITLMMASFMFGYWAVWGQGAAEHKFPLPLLLLRWFPLADQMRNPVRWMLPVTLGLALLAADAWRRLARARFAHARLLAALCFVLLTAESLTRPSAWEPVSPAMPDGLEYLAQQPHPSPVMMMPTAYERLMQEATWLGQPMANGYNGYYPPDHIEMMFSLAAAFPSPGALEKFRKIGIRFMAINTEESRKKIKNWDPARAKPGLEQIPGIKVVLRGNYLIIDLGPAETDLARIRENYEKLHREFIEGKSKK